MLYSSYSRPFRYKIEDKRTYLNTCEKLRKLRNNLTDENKCEFIVLSIKAHALRGCVPKSWHSMASK